MNRSSIRNILKVWMIAITVSILQELEHNYIDNLKIEAAHTLHNLDM